MAISASYYLNAPSLGSATAVFDDAALTTFAIDGFYSDGIISREQVSGVLLPQQTCPSCAVPCGEEISASGGQGIYLLDLDAGANVGAMVIRFDPYSIPDGIRATFDSVIYNKLTSPIDGIHESTVSGNFTYIGEIASDCGISGTTYPALPEYLYNGFSFIPTGNTQPITVNAGDVSLSSSAPGNTMMVIPKLTASPSIVNVEVVGPCSGTSWNIIVECPVLLTGFSSSVVAEDAVAVCLLSETVTYYNASLAGTSGTVGLYDFVYSDAYGSTPLAAGFYYAAGSIIGGAEWFEVDSNGIVISTGICAEPPMSINVTSVTGLVEYCDFLGQWVIGADVTIDTPSLIDSYFIVTVYYLPVGYPCPFGANTQSIYNVTIFAGNTSSNFNTCNDGAGFMDEKIICSACITACSNGAISLGIYSC